MSISTPQLELSHASPHLQVRFPETTARWCGVSAPTASTCTASWSGWTPSRCSSSVPCVARSGSSKSDVSRFRTTKKTVPDTKPGRTMTRTDSERSASSQEKARIPAFRCWAGRLCPSLWEVSHDFRLSKWHLGWQNLQLRNLTVTFSKVMWKLSQKRNVNKMLL